MTSRCQVILKPLQQQGKSRRTGELARREEEDKANENPFEKAKEPRKAEPQSPIVANGKDQVPTSDKAAHEEAPITEPESTTIANQQTKRGSELQNDAQVDSKQQSS